MKTRKRLKVGDRIHHWTVIAEFHGPWRKKGQADKKIYCRCDCGNEKSRLELSMYYKQSRSCCQIWRIIKNKPSEYDVWAGMIQRCTNKNSKCYKNYGGRGIFVCEEWRSSYAAFSHHVGCRPSLKYSLDRIDNEKGYFPGNVRWATRAQQSRNTRRNRYIEWEDKRFTIVDAAEFSGIKKDTLRMRLNAGWSVERAMTQPVRQNKK